MRLTRLNQLILGNELVEGNWQITPNHEIQYRRKRRTLHSPLEEEIALKGNLVAAEETGLTLQAWERREGEELISRLLTLRGRWEADARNRLSFLVERQSDRTDRLTLAAGWEVGPSHELLYRTTRRHLKTKERDLHTLTFRGYWDVTEANRLTYVLDRDSDSAFRFRGTFQSRALQAKAGRIRFQIGVQAEGRRRVQTVTLFGKWKLSHDLSLEFEVPYGDGAVQGIGFGASFELGARGTITGRLLARRGQPLGVELLFTRPFLKGQGEAFARLRRNLDENVAEAGLRVRW